MTAPRQPAAHVSPLVWVCTIVALVQLLTASGTIFGADGGKRFNVARNLWNEGRVSIDATERTAIGVDGRKYAQYAIGHSAAMVPFVALGQWVGRLRPALRPRLVEAGAASVNALATVAVVALLLMLVRNLGYSTRTAVIVSLLYAFATIAWQQGKDSFEHPLIALFVTAAVVCLHRYVQRQQFVMLMLAGLSLGCALATRYTSLLACVMVPVCLALSLRRGTLGERWSRAAAATGVVAACVLPFFALDLWYNALRFGNPLESGQQQLFDGLFDGSRLLEAGWWLLGGLSAGLLPFNPVLLVSICGVPALYRRHRALVIAATTWLALHLLFYASTKAALWQGGWAWGPRFFLDVMPLLMLGVAPIVEAWATLPRWRRRAAVAVIALSVVLQVGSVLVNYNRSFAKLEMHVDGRAWDRPEWRSLLLVMQLENLREVAANTRAGVVTDVFAPLDISGVDPAGAIDRFGGYGAFQLWWVYAWLGGVSGWWIVGCVASTVALIAWAAWRLRASLRMHQADGVSLECPCAFR